MYSFNHQSQELQDVFSGKPCAKLQTLPNDYSLMLPFNPLDDGMADIQSMFTTDDIVLAVEGVLENHYNSVENSEDPATGFVLENEKHGRHFVCVSDAKLGAKWSLTFWNLLSKV